MKKHFSVILALLLSFSLILGLCSCQRPEKTETNEKVQAAFDQFTLAVFQEEVSSDLLSLHYSLKDPKAYGITQYDISFGTYSLEAMRDGRSASEEQLKKLHSFSYEALTKAQQRTYDVFSWLLETEQSGADLDIYQEILGPVTGIQSQLPILLAEYPFYTRQDVEDYLALLPTVADYFTQIITFEQEKAAAGVFMADQTADDIIEACRSFSENPEESYLLSVFDERIDALDGLSEEEKAAYKERNRQSVLQDFLPAYQILIDGLSGLKGSGKNTAGLYYLPKGKEYYQYLLSLYTGTNRTPEEYEELMLSYINDSLSSMSELLRQYPEIMDQTDGFSFSLTDPEQILKDLESKLSHDFPSLPVEVSYQIKYVPSALEESLSPAFYLTPPLDAPTANVIYINNGSTQTSSLYNTLAHEGFPGHLYQTVYSGSCVSSPLRYILNFPGFSEGWATYVEEQAFVWDSAISTPLAQVIAYNDTVSLGLTALLDLYIHYYGFTLEDAAQFIQNYFGVTDSQSVEDIYSYIVAEPCNYFKYYGGYLEFRELRKEAEAQLGDAFSLKAFHQFLLEAGEAPFPLLESWMKLWISEQK